MKRVDDDVLYLYNSRFYKEPEMLYILESNTEYFFDEIGDYTKHIIEIEKMGSLFFNKVY